MEHELKIVPNHFSRIKDGSKTFEIADAYEGLQMGDTVVLKEWDSSPINVTSSLNPKGFTGSPDLKFKVGYVHVHNSQVIFSLLPVKK